MKKVSVLAPCYNVEKYISAFLDSLIGQNYSPIELVLVNDGSTDKTESVIFSYNDKLKANGIELKYFYKENGGQASAVALGIKEVTGEYLISMDSDDIFLEDSIKKRVDYLENNLACGIVRSNGYIYNENNIQNHIGEISKVYRTTLLKDFVNFSVPWANGCYMIRMSAFDRANPRRLILDFPVGQNIQMLLPVLYYYPCEYLDEYLFGYIIHSTSHSHSKKTYVQEVEKLINFEKCVKETLEVIPEDTINFFEIHKKFIRSRLYINAWNYQIKEDLIKYEYLLREYGEFSLDKKIMKYFSHSELIDFILRVYYYFERRLFRVN